MARSHYQECCPAATARWVEAFWWLDSAGEPRRILPDGCIDFIFDLERGQARAIGTMTGAQVVQTAAGVRYFGVRFAPGAAAALIDARADELTDDSARLDDVSRARRFHLAERVAEAPDHAARIALIGQYLQSSGARVRARDRRVGEAIEGLRAAHGRPRIREISAAVGVGERQLQRLFAEHVGVRPKLLSRVMRLQHALQLLHGAQKPHNVASLAQDAGFADEPHMVRELRALTGQTPQGLLCERDVGFVQDRAPAR